MSFIIVPLLGLSLNKQSNSLVFIFGNVVGVESMPYRAHLSLVSVWALASQCGSGVFSSISLLTTVILDSGGLE